MVATEFIAILVMTVIRLIVTVENHISGVGENYGLKECKAL
jgi:hypothetical protein